MDSLRLSGAAVVRAAAVSILAVGSFVSLPSPASAAPTITSKTVEPAVIPSGSSSGAVVTVRTDLPATSVAIDLEAGGTVPFVAIDSQTFSVVLTSAQLLFDYQPDDAKWILRIHQGDRRHASRRLLRELLRQRRRCVGRGRRGAVISVRHALRATRRQSAGAGGRPGRIWETLYTDEQTVLNRFYEVFGDSYDFANVVYLHPDLHRQRPIA